MPISGYVRAYLASEFGPPPYNLCIDAKNKLRLEFLSVETHSLIYSSLYLNDRVDLQIEDSAKLVAHYSKHKHLFDRGIFGAHDFFTALYMFVEFTCDNHLRFEGGNRKDLNYRIAIERFMQKYNISEDLYSYDNLYRQFCRQKRSRKVYQAYRNIQPDNSPFSCRLRPDSFFSKKHTA